MLLLLNRDHKFTIMPVVQKGDKAFPGAGTKPGLEIWRIEVCFTQEMQKIDENVPTLRS